MTKKLRHRWRRLAILLPLYTPNITCLFMGWEPTWWSNWMTYTGLAIWIGDSVYQHYKKEGIDT